MKPVDDIELSFVLPCLNEAQTVQECVAACRDVINKYNVVGEVVVADNGSMDGSREIASLAGARVISVSTRGYGNALMEGIRAARGKYVLMGDSDSSYDFGEMPRFLEKLRQGYGLVVGCRMQRGGGTIKPGAMPFLHRWLGNPALSFIGRLLFRLNIIDFHCGIRAFERERILALGLRAPGMEFASEMIVKAGLARLRITQVPVTLRRDGRNGPSHLRSWRDGWRHLRFMFLHAPRWLFLYPGLTMMFLAGLGFIGLLFGPVRVIKVQLDTNTLLACAVGVMVGFQIMLFGIFSEAYSQSVSQLPSNKLIQNLLGQYPFERGLLTGLPVFLSGLVLLFMAFIKWKNADFGNLDYPATLRLVIPSALGMSLGAQIIFGGFVLAVLGLNVERTK